MSRTLLHDWESSIEKNRNNTEELLKIAEDIYNTAYARGKASTEQPQGEWIGINEYINHLEEETGERYKVSRLYDGSIFCNQCWKMNDKKSCFCPNCGAKMKGSEE